MTVAFQRSKKTYDEPALYEYAIGALSRKMRSVAELKRLLRQRTRDEAMIQAVVDKLKDQKYLNDSQYAAAYSQYRIGTEKFGRMRVVTDLKARGVHGEVIDKAVGEAYSEIDEEKLARQYLARKRMKKPADNKQAAKIYRSLLRAGFSGRTVRRILNNWEVDSEVISALEEEAAPDNE